MVKAQPTINMVLSVPKDKEAEMDAFWKEHEAWMRKTHFLNDASKTDDASGPRISQFYISKGDEPKDAFKPEAGTTGNVLYIMSESYAAASGIAKHMEMGGKDIPEWFAKLTTEVMPKYAKVIDVGSTVDFTAFNDDDVPSVNPKAGEPGIHAYWKVPADKEAEMDAFWKEHEAWMRKSHTQDAAADDATTPRLSSFNIRKGNEFKDPFKPEEGTTGNVLYIMSETYMGAGGIQAHLAKAGAEMSKWFEQLTKYNETYLTIMDLGNTTVFTTM